MRRQPRWAAGFRDLGWLPIMVELASRCQASFMTMCNAAYIAAWWYGRDTAGVIEGDRQNWQEAPMDYSPTVRGRRLMRELTRLRHAQGLSLEVAAQRLDFSKSKLYRLENGRGRITLDDLEDMLDLYAARSPQREALVQLGRDARKRGWWTAYSDVFTGSYVGLESEASAIKVNAHLVPDSCRRRTTPAPRSPGPGHGSTSATRTAASRRASPGSRPSSTGTSRRRSTSCSTKPCCTARSPAPGDVYATSCDR